MGILQYSVWIFFRNHKPYLFFGMSPFSFMATFLIHPQQYLQKAQLRRYHQLLKKKKKLFTFIQKTDWVKFCSSVDLHLEALVLLFPNEALSGGATVPYTNMDVLQGLAPASQLLFHFLRVFSPPRNLLLSVRI